MAYAFVQLKEFSENRGTASAASVATGAFGASLTAGNLLIATVAYLADPDGGARTVTLSGAGSPTWNEETALNDGAGNYVHYFYAMNIGGGTTAQLSAAFAGNGDSVRYPAIACAEYSGFKTSGARLAFAAQTQATPTTSTDATTSGLLGTLAAQPAGIVGFSFNTAGVATPAVGTSFSSGGTGWTYEGATTACLRLEDRRVTATTSVGVTFTAGNNSEHQTGGWAFEEATGGGTSILRQMMMQH